MISAMVLAEEDAGAREAFRSAGFETGEAVGGTFAITGPKDLFEATFKVRLRLEGEQVTVEGSGQDPYELPLGDLDDGLRRRIRLATFSPPPDFGPTSW